VQPVPATASLRFNPHFHALILEGGLDSIGQFYYLPIYDTARLSECLRRGTIALFLTRGLISEQFATTLLCWRHSGFSVDNEAHRPDHRPGRGTQDSAPPRQDQKGSARTVARLVELKPNRTAP